MAIVNTDLVWRKTEVMNGLYELDGSPVSSPTNGGIMLADVATSAVKNAIFPDAPQSELTVGSIAYRKVAIHVSNAWDESAIDTAGEDLNLVQPRVFIETYTPGDDAVSLVEGTAVDTQTDITGSEDQYGSAQLDSSVSATDTTCDVYVEDDEDGTPMVIFRVDDLVRISDKTSVSDATPTHYEEYVTLTAVGSFTGNVQTLSWAVGDALVNAYAAVDTRVASVIKPSTLVATADTVTTPTGSGTITGADILVNNLGCVEDTWTVEFDNATQYTITGAKTGLLSGTGAIGSTFSPQNTDFGTNPPYMKMPGSGSWGGTWADGDTFTFKTHVAAANVWYRRMIPAATSSLTANKVIVGITGQST